MGKSGLSGDLIYAGRYAFAVAMLGTAMPTLAQDEEPVEEQVPGSPPQEMLAFPGDQPVADEAEFALTAAPRVYYPADFASFNPRTALDMVRQIPGFNIDGGGRGNNQNRGLGQASGNVLLNGERIVIKAGSITDELTRIGAANVIRIELVEGSSLNIPGLSGRVANVITSSTDGIEGQFEWRPQLAATYADAGWLEGIASLSGTFGDFGFTVAVEGRPVRNGNGGPNIITFGDGTVQERFSLNKANGNDKRLSGSMSYRSAGGLVANLNGSYLHRRFRAFEDEIVTGPMGALPLTEEFDQRNRGHDLELGGDVDFDLGPGRLKLIGLDRSQTLSFLSQSVTDPANGDPAMGSQFSRTSESGERIGRGEYGWSMWNSDWQWSFEGAFNRLDQTGELFILQDTGDFVQVPFPAGNGGVREDRFETLMSYGRQLADDLTVQLIVGGEYSKIRQTGADPNSRSFLRPKGSLSLGWSPQDNLDISMRIDRRVGQLNFGDFLASVSLDENNENDSNNELRPDQSWGGELEVTRDLGAWGSVTVRGFLRRFEDFVTIIPTEAGGEARGNVDWARVMGIGLNGTLQLDPVGLPGAKFDVEFRLRDSRYPDPVEDGYLPVEFAQPHNVEIDFRYDVPSSNWAFGAGFRDSGFNPYYRVREFGVSHSIDRNVTAFIEHKDVFGLTVQVRYSNLLEREIVLEREVYTGPRGSGAPLLFSENRRREVGRVVNLNISGNF
jgi:hypothetical protein